MPLPRVSIRSFLSSAKTAINNAVKQSSPITFVIGNESADLDSLCSAVVLAYLRTYTSKSSTLYVPLSNLPRADLSLRPELLPVLSHANLKPEDLITLSDLPPNSTRIPPNKTRWILVDHNTLHGELGEVYGSRLVGVIDHHDEENKVPKDCGEEPRIVKKSGSCSSLVVEYCRGAWNSLAATTEEEKLWNAQLARLAIAPILIDTANLTFGSKTTPLDVEAVEYLEYWFMMGDKGKKTWKYAVKEFYEEITKAKENIGQMSLKDILRKDYKQWTEGDSSLLGMSSVVKSFPFLLEKAGGSSKFSEALKDFAKERGLAVFAIMTTSHPNDDFRRELLVQGLDEKGSAAAKKFTADARKELGLAQWRGGLLDSSQEDEATAWRRCWQQNNVQHSRKQVAPLLRSALAS